jgi:signal transduction histidine kinase/ligand-binding sensor domain-containing protein/DNA-binding response OmpR family regulator
MNIRLISFSLLLSITYPCPAQQSGNNLFIERIGEFNTSIQAIHKDRNGFMWLGGWDGLFRFDGINVKSYNHIIPTWTNFFIQGISEDKDGNLWLVTALHDFILFNPETDSARKVSELFPQIVKEGLFSSSISTYNNNVALATNMNLYIVNHTTRRYYKKDIAQFKQATRFLKYDELGNLWVGLSNGLLKLSLTDELYYEEFSHHLTGPVEIDKKGNLWIGTMSGVLFYDPGIRTKIIYTFQDISPSNEVNALALDNQESLWVGAKGGLIQYNLITKESNYYTSRNDDPFTINGNNIRELFYSKDDDILWIGTDEGLNKIVFNKQHFHTIPLNLKDELEAGVKSIYQDSDLNLWITTRDDIIHLVLNNNGLQSQIISLEPLFFIFEDEQRDMFFLSGYKAPRAVKLDRSTRKVKELNIDLIPNSTNPVKYIGNQELIAKDEGRVTLISIGDTLRVKNHNLIGKVLNSSVITVDQYDNILASGEGLYEFNKENLSFKNLWSHESHHPIDITIMAKDLNNMLWFGTYGTGLWSYNLTSGEFKNYGYRDRTYSAILIDDHYIWASTNKGLLRLNSKTYEVTIYTRQDGLRFDKFIHRSFLQGKDGQFYFGGRNQILSFNPKELTNLLHTPNIYITSLKVNNQSITELGNSDKRSIEYQSEIILNYNQNTVNLEFVSLNYAYPTKNNYHFQLTGVDSDWITSESFNQVTYSNLKPGAYTFKVKATNPHNIGETETKEMRIIILYPPWKTWWAYTLYFMLGSIILYIAVRQALVRSQLKSEAFHNKIEANKLHEIDKLKSRFFANISHEFRTPLTLLLAPLENKLKQAQTPEEKAEFSLMHRSASRLLTLVNQLLDLSRLEAGTLKLNLKHTNLGNLITTITSQFASMADSKKINFQVNVNEAIELFVDHDKVEKIITNLLSNAFKFTPAHGSITLSISTGEPNKTFTEGFAEIKVTDTGAGIATAHLNKIFDRFYQVDASSTRESEGTGIGLALTKELVELHKGTITVESEPGKGSTFTVWLPIGFLHLKADELTLEAQQVKPLSQYMEFELPENPSLRSEAASEKVLVIEDNADLRIFIRNELEKTYSVLEAVDGEAGLKSAFEHIPTLIITDLMMPKRDGLQLCEILKNDQRTSHIPVILLTAKADIETKLQGLKTGADEYIAKPFVMDELLARIQNLLENRKRLRAKYTTKLALRPAEVKVESLDERFLRNIMEVVEVHFSDSSFGVEQFTKETGMSQAQLYRKLHALTGFTPNEFVRHMRLERAADLFKQKAGNVADVAYQVGFNNLSYFAKCFKEKFGVSPSQFLSTKGVPGT